MACSGVCCASLEEPKSLMKMGLCMVLVGHVNFLLGALVQGVVLRHINLNEQAWAVEYAISNVVALTSGLVTWSLFSVSLAAALMAAASAVGLSVSVVWAAVHGERSLLTHCRFPDAAGYSSITAECPFDPTRVYSTTLILWVPLIVTCVTQTVFSSRCSAVCVSFLGLPCCPTRKRSRRDYGRAINVVRPMEEAAPSCNNDPPRSYTEPPTCYNDPPSRYNDPPSRYNDPPSRYNDPPRSYIEPPCYNDPPPRYSDPSRSYAEPPTRCTEPPRSYRQPPRRNTEPPRQHHRPPPPPQRLLHQHRSLPPSERRPLHQPHRGRSDEERLKTRVGSQQRPPQEHQLLERGTHERSSFWI
ncbi:keratinocyte-associated protein 3-like isoform X2 [Perca fluviatilis]|uniref:keratinocyte-associated protein 3-like isoform X2 n=1 Tax=Perca fluviatilis TaxID=8168 RepID=UPI0019649956|nr:keratinocyte-associated protein 3-like isoform X2 [Perca fluviatilis]